MFVFDKVAWPETMVDGRNQLCRPEKDAILAALSKGQHVDPSYRPFGDGHAAEKILAGIDGLWSGASGAEE